MTVRIPNIAGNTLGRFMRAMSIANGDPAVAANYLGAKAHEWSDALALKAAVQGMTMLDRSAGGQIVGNDLMALVAPQTIVGRLTKIRRLPFEVRVLTQARTHTAYWVNEAEPVPPSSVGSFIEVGRMRPRKVAALSVCTEEAARADETTESVVIQDLVAASVEAIDAAFIDPANAGVDGVKPASVTHDALSFEASDNPEKDIADALGMFPGNLLAATWVMTPYMAAQLRLRGQPFENVSVLGGSLLGIPVITSNSMPVDSDRRSSIALLDQSSIDMAGSLNEAQVRVSSVADILMENPAAPVPAQLVSMWQTNSMAFLAVIPTNWVAREGAAVLIEDASYE